MAVRDLLIEIGTEELPPKALARLSKSFSDSICDQLRNRSLHFSVCHPYATPRRLAVLLSDLEESQPDKDINRPGPAVKAAFDADGNPTKAAEGFARSCGVAVDKLQRFDSDGVEKLRYSTTKKGVKTQALIPEIVDAALAQLPIPKRMRWGSARVEFIRPVHWVVLLFGDELINASILGIESGKSTRGHRFHTSEPIALANAAEYESVMETKGHVIVDFAKRKQMIKNQVVASGENASAMAVIDDSLLDEVTALVEYPVALTGNFDKEYLEVPPEALVLAMKSHQKCFYIIDEKNKLLPKFITVSNIESTYPAQVIAGNERVIRPRLADARFFYETDRQQTLESHFNALGKLVFQEKLGTVKDKCERVETLARYLAKAISANAEYCTRAARLSKCDLLTNMVGEFADLQGLMGSYYARHDGEPEEVALAINEQYQPRFSGDDVPSSITGCVLAIADKLDSVIGLFGTGQPPTGSKDPFALRRAAIGILRIIIEKELALDLKDCIETAVSSFEGIALEPETKEKVFDFFLDRFRAWYLDEGISAEEFQSVYELRPSKPLDFHKRIQAVSRFNTLPEAAALAAINKRVANILSKHVESTPDLRVNEALFADEAESNLFILLAGKEREVEPLFLAGNYTDGLASLATMKDTVDCFFDEVLVMADEDELRDNRLALLRRLQALFLHTADISHLYNG